MEQDEPMSGHSTSADEQERPTIDVLEGTLPPSPEAVHLPQGGTALFNPCGIAVSAAGKVYIADTGHHRVCVLESRGREQTALLAEGQGAIRAELADLRAEDLPLLEPSPLPPLHLPRLARCAGPPRAAESRLERRPRRRPRSHARRSGGGGKVCDPVAGPTRRRLAG